MWNTLYNERSSNSVYIYLHKLNISREQYECFPSTDDAHESHEKTYSEIHGKIHEEAHHDEVYEAYDEVQVRGRMKPVYEEDHEAPKTITVTKRIEAGSNNAVEVAKITDYLVSTIINNLIP